MGWGAGAGRALGALGRLRLIALGTLELGRAVPSHPPSPSNQPQIRPPPPRVPTAHPPAPHSGTPRLRLGWVAGGRGVPIPPGEGTWHQGVSLPNKGLI